MGSSSVAAANSRYSLIPSRIQRSPLPPSIKLPKDLKPRYNIAPMQMVPVIRFGERQSQCELMRWGFQPGWLHDERRAQPNAQARNIFLSVMFRDSTVNRRCIVPASGWYEWPDDNDAERPWYFRRKNDGLIAFAGIWTTSDSTGWTEGELNFAILTMEAISGSGRCANRTPVILPRHEYETWLDPNNRDVGRLDRILSSNQPADLESYPVTFRVNDLSYDDVRCVQPLSPQEREGLGAPRHI